MKAGLYIHIPFCLKKCGYCDFYSETKEASAISAFLMACGNEMELRAEHPIFSQAEFQTCYLGGGTPSLLAPEQIESLFSEAQRWFDFGSNLEFTIEANPETVSLSKLQDYRSIGINRLSLGIQSFDNLELQVLGRIHQAEQAEQSIDWAYRAGFENVSLDLIFAIPGQTMAGWQANLKKAIQFKPRHLSIYGLTLEPGTPMQQRIAAGELTKVNEEVERDLYLGSIDELSQAGYQQYEISNFAVPGLECQHNSGYWNGTTYLGIGPSAHSFWPGHRQWNVASVENYVNLLQHRVAPIAGQEELSWQQQMLEFIYLSLRTRSGVDIGQFEARFRQSFIKKFGNVFDRLTSYPEGDIFQIEGNQFKLTPPGMVLFDEICQYFADGI